MKKFIKELFIDDSGEACIGRFSLFLGMLLTVITGVWGIDTIGDLTAWEAIVRTSPGLIGLVAYIFTRLAEMKEWVSDLTKNLTKGKK